MKAVKAVCKIYQIEESAVGPITLIGPFVLNAHKQQKYSDLSQKQKHLKK